MKRIPWRSLLIWAVPVLAFAWLAIAGRAMTSHPVVPPVGALLGGGAIGSKFVPLASYQPHDITSTHTGRLGLSTASGIWRVKVARRNAQGKRADSCDSGPSTGICGYSIAARR